MEKDRAYSEHTVQSYLKDLLEFVSFLRRRQGGGLVSLEKMKTLQGHDFLSWLQYLSSSKNLSNRSIRRAIASVKNFFQYCAEKKLIEEMPIEVLRGPKFKAKLPSIADSKNIIQLLQDPGEDWVEERNKALLLLLYTSGMRISEALSIRFHIWRGTDSSLQILGKGKKERIVPLMKLVRERVNRYLRLCPHSICGKQKIFVGKRGGELRPEVIQAYVRSLRHTLSSSVTPHSFRHAFATHLLQNGADLRSIQELLGHERLSTTQIYTHLNVKKMQDVYNKAHPRAR